MQTIIPEIISFLGGEEVGGLSLVSSLWLRSIRDEERRILQGLWRMYPSDTTYESIIKAIQNEDISRIHSIMNNYISYLPIRLTHILFRMLWRDIPVNDNMRIIAYDIFERTLRDIREHSFLHRELHILRLFAFKFEVFDMINRVAEIDTTGYDYEDYEGTEDYIRISPNVQAIVSNRIQTYSVAPEELFQVVTLALANNRIDVLDYMYEQDVHLIRHIVEEVLHDNRYTFCTYREDMLEWIRSIGIQSDNLCKYPYIDISDLSSPNLMNISLPVLSEYFTQRNNIQRVMQESSTSLFPEVYFTILNSLSRNDSLFWDVITHAARYNVSEVLEKYIITDVDAEKVLIRVRQLYPLFPTNMFFRNEWYSYRREILLQI